MPEYAVAEYRAFASTGPLTDPVPLDPITTDRAAAELACRAAVRLLGHPRAFVQRDDGNQVYGYDRRDLASEPVTRAHCLVCGSKSANPADVADGYCGHCHTQTAVPVTERRKSPSIHDPGHAARLAVPGYPDITEALTAAQVETGDWVLIEGWPRELVHRSTRVPVDYEGGHPVTLWFDGLAMTINSATPCYRVRRAAEPPTGPPDG